MDWDSLAFMQAQYSQSHERLTLPRSIPQGIEAGWRKPEPSRGSVHESPTGRQAGCGPSSLIHMDICMINACNVT